MPALSSPPGGPVPFSSPSYLFLAVILLLVLGTVVSRLWRHFSQPSRLSPPAPLMEKAPLISPAQGPSSTNPPFRLPGPHPPKAPGFPLSQPPSSEVDLDTPRRRSYTKMTSAGTEITGEIVVAEGWRRHTKVFGGGVCAACEENERRLAKVIAGGGPNPAAGGLA